MNKDKFNKFESLLENKENEPIINPQKLKKQKQNKKISYTYSLTEEENQIMITEAKKRGYRSKSELLSDLIKQIK